MKTALKTLSIVMLAFSMALPGGFGATAIINAQTTTPILSSVNISPSNPAVNSGSTVQLTASPMDQNSTAFNGATTTYTSSNNGIATVDNNGLITGVSQGTATITASSVSGGTTVTKQVNLTVNPSSFTPTLTSVNISPSSPTVNSGSTVQLTASPMDQNGSSFMGATTTYSSSNNGVATVDNNGLITGVSQGTATITASSVSGGNTVTKQVNLTVNPSSTNSTLTSVSIVPTIMVGNTVQLKAFPMDQNGSAFSGATTTYTSSNTGVATVNSTGLITGVSQGMTTITASSVSGGTTVTGKLQINVASSSSSGTAPTIVGLSGNTSIKVGDTETVTVNASDPNNGSLSYSVDWGDTASGLRAMASTNPFVQTATFTHVYNTAGTYTATFTVKNEGGETASSSMVINVSGSSTSNPVLTSVTISPNNSSVQVGSTVQLTASPKDQNGSAFSGATTTYSSSNTGVATVNNNGLVTGVSQGTSTITASSVNAGTTVTGTATITVTTGSTNNSKAPNISGITAPTVLSIGQVGTWKVVASDPQNGSLTYAVDWGDTSNNQSNMMMAQELPFNQTGTFTHAYSNAGVYTVKFTVSSNSGLSNTSTVTVNVGSSGGTSSKTLGSIALMSNRYTISQGDTEQMRVVLKADKTEARFTDPTVTSTYSSSNPSIVKVDSNGMVTGMASGSATITATSTQGNKTVSDTAVMTVRSSGGGTNNTNTTTTTNNQNKGSDNNNSDNNKTVLTSSNNNQYQNYNNNNDSRNRRGSRH